MRCCVPINSTVRLLLAPAPLRHRRQLLARLRPGPLAVVPGRHDRGVPVPGGHVRLVPLPERQPGQLQPNPLDQLLGGVGAGVVAAGVGVTVAPGAVDDVEAVSVVVSAFGAGSRSKWAIRIWPTTQYIRSSGMA